VEPTSTDEEPEIDEMPETGFVTVMLFVELYPPSSVVAVIVAEPAAIPVTTPDEFTVAIEVLDEDQLIILIGASDGVTDALSVIDEPVLTDENPLIAEIPVTAGPT
jgi:hypothetical protein